MGSGYQNAFTTIWNRIVDRLRRRRAGRLLFLGNAVRSGSATSFRIGIPEARRTEHIAVLGKTGTGKTSLLRHLCKQDIAAGHGFAFFDLHGDTAPYLLGLVAQEEAKRNVDLSSRTILIDPADPDRSIGLNILEATNQQEAFVEIAEITAILKHRWNLDALGVRTEELLRHSLFVLVSNKLTFLELSQLLVDEGARLRWVRKTPASEAHTYFESRYNLLSPEMQTVYREAILNKISLYLADPRFRHLLGQTRSTINLKRAIDSGCWIIINLEKGRLGEEAATLGALLLAKLKHAILGRNNRRLFTLYCDELQNLVAYDAAIDVLLSEARKFGIGVVSANQYLDQYPVAMRAAILAMGSHAYLQLSGLDAERVAHWLGGGRMTADRLRTLPKRHVLVRQSDHRLEEALVPDVPQPRAHPLRILRRVRARWTVGRRRIEEQIRERQMTAQRGRKDFLGDDWQ